MVGVAGPARAWYHDNWVDARGVGVHFVQRSKRVQQHTRNMS